MYEIHVHGTVTVNMVDPAVARAILRIDRKLNEVREQGVEIMADLTELQAAVAEDTDVTSSAVTLLESLADMLDDAGTDPAALAEITSTLRSNSQRLAEAVAANTPGAGGATEPASESGADTGASANETGTGGANIEAGSEEGVPTEG